MAETQQPQQIDVRGFTDYSYGVEGVSRLESRELDCIEILIKKVEDKLETVSAKTDGDYWLGTLRMIYGGKSKGNNENLRDRLSKLLGNDSSLKVPGKNKTETDDYSLNELVDIVEKFINNAGDYYASGYRYTGRISVDTARLVTRLNTNSIIYNLLEVNNNGKLTISPNGQKRLEQLFIELVNTSSAMVTSYTDDSSRMNRNLLSNIIQFIQNNKPLINTGLSRLTGSPCDVTDMITSFVDKMYKELTIREILNDTGRRAMQAKSSDDIYSALGGAKEIIGSLNMTELDMVILRAFDNYLKHKISDGIPPNLFGLNTDDKGRKLKKDEHAIANHIIRVIQESKLADQLPEDPNIRKRFIIGRLRQIIGVGFISGATANVLAMFPNVQEITYHAKILRIYKQIHNAQTWDQGIYGDPSEQSFKAGAYTIIEQLMSNPRNADPKSIAAMLPLDPNLNPKKAKAKRMKQARAIAESMKEQDILTPDQLEQALKKAGIRDHKFFNELVDITINTFFKHHGIGEMMQNWETVIKNNELNFRELLRFVVDRKGRYRDINIGRELEKIGINVDALDEAYNNFVVLETKRKKQRLNALDQEENRIRQSLDADPNYKIPEDVELERLAQERLDRLCSQNGDDARVPAADDQDQLTMLGRLKNEIVAEYKAKIEEEVRRQIDEIVQNPDHPINKANYITEEEQKEIDNHNNPRFSSQETPSPAYYQIIREAGVPTWLSRNAGGARQEGVRKAFTDETGLVWDIDYETGNVVMDNPKRVLDWLIERGGLEEAYLFVNEIVAAEVGKLGLKNEHRNRVKEILEKESSPEDKDATTQYRKKTAEEQATNEGFINSRDIYIAHRTQTLKGRLAYEFSLKDPYNFLFNLKSLIGDIDDGYLYVDYTDENGKEIKEIVPAWKYYFSPKYDNKGSAENKKKRSIIIGQIKSMLGIENIDHFKNLMNFFTRSMDDVAEVLEDEDSKLKGWKTDDASKKKGKIDGIRKLTQQALFDTLSHAHQLVILRGGREMEASDVFSIRSMNIALKSIGMETYTGTDEDSFNEIDEHLKRELNKLQKGDEKRMEIVRLRMALRVRRSLFGSGSNADGLMTQLKFMAPRGADDAFGSYDFNDFRKFSNEESGIARQIVKLNLNSSGSLFKNMAYAWDNFECKNMALTSGDLITTNLLTTNYGETGSGGSFGGLVENYKSFPEFQQALNNIPARIKRIASLPKSTGWREAFKEVFDDHKKIKEVVDDWLGKAGSRRFQYMYASALIRGLIHDPYCRLPPPFGIIAMIYLGKFLTYGTMATKSPGEGFVLSDTDADSYVHELYRSNLISAEERNKLVEEIQIETWRLNMIIGIPITLIGAGISTVGKITEAAKEGIEGEK